MKPPGITTRSPKARQLARGHACSPWLPARCRPHRGWHGNHRQWLGPAGSAGAGQSVQPRRGWCCQGCRITRRCRCQLPPPRLPACRPVLHPCRREGSRLDGAREKPGIGSAAEEGRRLKAPGRNPHGPSPAARGFRCSGRQTWQSSAGSASRGKRPLRGPAGLLPEQRVGSNSWGLRRSSASPLAPPGVRHACLCWDFGMTSPGFTHLGQAKKVWLLASPLVCPPTHSARAKRMDHAARRAHRPEMPVAGESRAAGSSQPVCPAMAGVGTARGSSLPGPGLGSRATS